MSEKLAKALSDHIGTTHTVEIHPHMDHLYRVKDHLKEKGGSGHISAMKKMGLSPDVLASIPRDGKGKVTADGIDKHIESLPKKKVDLSVLPDFTEQQKHRKNPTFAVSMSMPKDEVDKMSDKTKDLWGRIKTNQHSIGQDGELDAQGRRNSSDEEGATPYPDRVGWVRVDPHHNKEGEAKEHDHWHMNEIQSDFQNPKKIKYRLGNDAPVEDHPKYDQTLQDEEAAAAEDKDHPLAQRYKENESSNFNVDRSREIAKRDHVENVLRKKDPSYFQHGTPEEQEELLNHISLGHDDPQHALHSALNQLGRKLGVESTSIDMPKDQGNKSALQSTTGPNRPAFQFNEQQYRNHHINSGNMSSQEQKDSTWGEGGGEDLMKEHRDDPDFSSAVGKLGGMDKLKEFAGIAHQQTHGGHFEGEHGDWTDVGEDGPSVPNHHKLNDDEKNALSSFLLEYHGKVQDAVPESSLNEERTRQEAAHNERYPIEEEKKRDLPVHQINTYKKRPKKLGFKPTDKDALLGQDSRDNKTQVQFSKLHKNIRDIRALLKKIKEQ